MKYTVIDLETDGLLDEVTKIHVLSYRIYESKTLLDSGSITVKEKIRSFLEEQEVLVGHNVIIYDKAVLLKLIPDIRLPPMWDTLSISWYLDPKGSEYGLEYYGEVLGTKKPVIEDWQNLTEEEYIHRCEMDVEINSKLFHQQMDFLFGLYENDIDAVKRIMNYLAFKMDCLREQELIKTPVNIELCKKHLSVLKPMFEESTEKLSSVMPKDLGKILKRKPKVLYKADGELSVNGFKWFDLLQELNLSVDTEEIREPPNPSSVSQLKAWLDRLGWVPETFKESKSKGNYGAEIPQINLPFGGGVCPSVKKLYEKEPNLELLDTYYKIRHRIGVFEGFIQTEKNGYVVAKAMGFSRSARLQHTKPIVNLPKPGVFWGKECREVVEAPEGHLIVGNDISGLEDATKRHFIYPYDPKYVEEMNVEGFDPHTDIAVLAHLMTAEEEKEYKRIDTLKDKATEEDKAVFKKLKKARGTAKSVNFSSTYGVGVPKLSVIADCSLEEAAKLHKTYWDRNWSVKAFTEDVRVRAYGGKWWLFNPLSKFWYYLENKKDIFSLCNQSAGVYVFDMYLREVRRQIKPLGLMVMMQYHDELGFTIPSELKETVKKRLKRAEEILNHKLKLNVRISTSIDIGRNYAEAH